MEQHCNPLLENFAPSRKHAYMTESAPGVIDQHVNTPLNHRQITVLVIGAGMRGNTYSNYAKNFPSRMRIAGIAEPRDSRRKAFAKRFDVAEESCFVDWKEAAKREKFAEAVIIATLDDQHYEPCLAFARLGYHILCEKPMACTERECEEMVRAALANKIIFTVGHVLRYAVEYRRVKELIEDGAIGELIGIDHVEPVGWWHFAHSYVRGNWSKQTKDSGSLMAKCCHDLDLVKYFLGDTKCIKIQSFGGLTHFKAEKKPPGASDRCLDCSVESTCPYSAVRQYLNPVQKGAPDLFCFAVCDVPDVENMLTALRDGPYGRCVYASDNDVCDYQSVNMEFEGGKYVTVTMSAFTKAVCRRKITLMGSRGEIVCDGNSFRLFDFDKETTSVFTPNNPPETTDVTGHGFADYYLIQAFAKAVALGDPLVTSSGPEDSLRGHRMVFAAERSRLLGGQMLEVNI